MTIENCPDCFTKVEVEIHLGTGKKVYWKSGMKGISLHYCMKKYWCIDCNAAIPFKNPCVHRREKLGANPKGLDNFT